MSVLKVQDLCKHYPTFELKNISFSLKEGKITGFIGRNGAGKTTTLKSIFNFVHPDSGVVEFFGINFADDELKIKQTVGFVSGGVDYYSQKKVKTITAVTKLFYDRWDDKAYSEYMKKWNIDENKTPSQLSAGMKVKYALALALSHNAQLLILDEPTSGLDPVSRDELLDIFMELCDKGVTILFSTHITSDLDKCADNILYISNGQLLADCEIRSFVDGYKVLELQDPLQTESYSGVLIGLKRSKSGYSALIKTEDAKRLDIAVSATDLETIMVHIEKEANV